VCDQLLSGTRDRIRTCDLRLRRALLYPAELRGLCLYVLGLYTINLLYFQSELRLLLLVR
jgi:hypothetical protein